MPLTAGCDVAVVGGGTAGCVVAGLLAENGADVVLLEAGPDYGSRASGSWPVDLLDAGALSGSHDWGYANVPVPGRGPLPFPRARVIGGCSSHNGAIAAVGCPEDYDGWAVLTGDPGWGADAMRPRFARVLERLRVRVYPDEEVGPFHRACIEAAFALGLPRADDLHDLDGGVGFGVEPANVEDGVRINAAFAYLDPVRSSGRLRVLDRALCDRVIEDGSGVVVVARRDGSEARLRAGRVVLTAGAFGSPAILLRSGVGDPGELAAAGVAATHGLPGVGRNLHDHPIAALELSGSDALAEALRAAEAVGFTPEEQSLGKAASSRSSGRYDLHLIPVAPRPESLLAGSLMIAVSALEPRSRGRLRLAGPDPESAPLIDVGFLTDPDGHDLAVLLEGIELARALVVQEPLASLAGREIAPGIGADQAAAVRQTYDHYYHSVGTCAMGPGLDPHAVCDSMGRVHGLERVLVADCSLMPVVPRANTNVPAAVVAERIVEHLLRA